MSEYQQLYRMYDKDGRLLYVGISKSALARYAQHAAEKAWIGEVVRMDVQTIPCARDEIVKIESRAIEQEQPRYNVAGNSRADRPRQRARRSKPETAATAQKLPKLCRHKRTGLAFIVLRMPDGRRVQKYLGPYGSDEAKAAYESAIANWPATMVTHVRPQIATGLAPTVELLVAEYLGHAEHFYRNANGVLPKSFANLVDAARPLMAVLRKRPTATVTCADLDTVRTTFATAGWGPTHVNDTMRRVLAMFRWGVEEGLVPGPVWHALSTYRHARLCRDGQA